MSDEAAIFAFMTLKFNKIFVQWSKKETQDIHVINEIFRRKVFFSFINCIFLFFGIWEAEKQRYVIIWEIDPYNNAISLIKYPINLLNIISFYSILSNHVRLLKLYISCYQCSVFVLFNSLIYQCINLKFLYVICIQMCKRMKRCDCISVLFLHLLERFISWSFESEIYL